MNPQIALHISQLHQQELREAARQAREAHQLEGRTRSRRFAFTLRIPGTAVVTAQQPRTA